MQKRKERKAKWRETRKVVLKKVEKGEAFKHDPPEISGRPEEHIADERKIVDVENMAVHTAVSEIPRHINPMVEIAESFGEAITDHLEEKETRAWIDRDKNLREEGEREAGSSHQSKRDRENKNIQESSMYAGAYAKSPPRKGPKMATIQEKETKKTRTDPQGSKTRDVAHHEDTIAKLANRIESSKQKEDATLISEIPTDLWLKEYTEEMKEDGRAAKEEIFRNKPKDRSINIRNWILKRSWWGA